MAAPNYDLAYRPLRPGSYIYNPRSRGGGGTLGIVATSDGGDRWILSCYHILIRGDMSAFGTAEAIYQPVAGMAPDPVAFTDGLRLDKDLDCAAARCVEGIEVNRSILGVGAPGDPTSPVVGMRVRKSGSATGITEAVVAAVNGDFVRIDPLPDHPPSYAITAVGDSGAVWVESLSNKIVAMNIGPIGAGARSARALKATALLERLQLHPL